MAGFEVSTEVLLLGRFSTRRKAVLEKLRTILKGKGYIPLLFDFTRPASRDLTETIRTLAHLSRFIIADLTEPRSVPHELAQIIPQLPSVPLQPFISIRSGPAYGMFDDYKHSPWVLPIQQY